MPSQPVSPSNLMPYRLALDFGNTLFGWALIRFQRTSLTQPQQPCTMIKAGVHIFSDGRNPKNWASLTLIRVEKSGGVKLVNF